MELYILVALGHYDKTLERFGVKGQIVEKAPEGGNSYRLLSPRDGQATTWFSLEKDRIRKL
jgi:hypothetical protein